MAVSHFAKWDGSSWSALGTCCQNGPTAIAIDGSNNIYVTGGYYEPGLVNALNIASWDGMNWSALGSGLNNGAWVLAVDAAGRVYVGGDFTTAGGITVNHVAVYVPGPAAAVTFGAAPPPTYPGDVHRGYGKFTVSASADSGVAITYAKVSGPCYQNFGAMFTATGVGMCLVKAYAAPPDNGSYASGSSHPEHPDQTRPSSLSDE